LPHYSDVECYMEGTTWLWLIEDSALFMLTTAAVKMLDRLSYPPMSANIK